MCRARVLPSAIWVYGSAPAQRARGWSLHLSGSHWIPGDGSGDERYEPKGRLQPILVDGLGKPLVAAWIAPSDMERWYIIPVGTSWDSILDWLVQRALPEYAPNALRPTC